MASIRFNPEINSGNILVALTILATSLGVFFSLRSEVNVVKNDISHIKEVQIEQGVKINSMEEKVNVLYYSQPKIK